MKNHIFWYDTETTGLLPTKHDIVVLGINIEATNGKILSEEIYMRPERPENISQEALKINGLTKKQVMAFPPAAEGLIQLKEIMAKFVNQYDPQDKFIQAGFNILRFDSIFLRQLFTNLGDKFYGSWFFNANLDVVTTVAEWVIATGKVPSNFKLVTMCAELGIDLKNAHTALEDTTATRKLYYALKKEIG